MTTSHKQIQKSTTTTKKHGLFLHHSCLLAWPISLHLSLFLISHFFSILSSSGCQEAKIRSAYYHMDISHNDDDEKGKYSIHTQQQKKINLTHTKRFCVCVCIPKMVVCLCVCVTHSWKTKILIFLTKFFPMIRRTFTSII